MCAYCEPRVRTFKRSLIPVVPAARLLYSVGARQAPPGHDVRGGNVPAVSGPARADRRAVTSTRRSGRPNNWARRSSCHRPTTDGWQRRSCGIPPATWSTSSRGRPVCPAHRGADHPSQPLAGQSGGPGYCLPVGAWHYERTGLTGVAGAGPYLAVVIPDGTPDGPFTPMPAQHAAVLAGGGVVPSRILARLIEVLDSSGDLVDERRYLADEATALPATLPATLNVWSHESSRLFCRLLISAPV